MKSAQDLQVQVHHVPRRSPDPILEFATDVIVKADHCAIRGSDLHTFITVVKQAWIGIHLYGP